MCRNSQQLRGADPPTCDEIRGAPLQNVRKVSGHRVPSRTDGAAFEAAVDEAAVTVTSSWTPWS